MLAASSGATGARIHRRAKELVAFRGCRVWSRHGATVRVASFGGSPGPELPRRDGSGGYFGGRPDRSCRGAMVPDGLFGGCRKPDRHGVKVRVSPSGESRAGSSPGRVGPRAFGPRGAVRCWWVTGLQTSSEVGCFPVAAQATFESWLRCLHRGAEVRRTHPSSGRSPGEHRARRRLTACGVATDSPRRAMPCSRARADRPLQRS